MTTSFASNTIVFISAARARHVKAPLGGLIEKVYRPYLIKKSTASPKNAMAVNDIKV